MKIRERRVPVSQWQRALQESAQSEFNFFCMNGTPSYHRTESDLQLFIDSYLEPSPFSGHFSLVLDFEKSENLAVIQDKVQIFCKSLSNLESRSERILCICGELFLNATLSASRAAQLNEGSHAASLSFEVSSTSLWIHCWDGYGSFSRVPFSQSFRDEGNLALGHGNSGRGLKLILDCSTDLYAKSRMQKGTWVAVRVDLVQRGRDADLEPKWVYLDLL